MSYFFFAIPRVGWLRRILPSRICAKSRPSRKHVAAWTLIAPIHQEHAKRHSHWTAVGGRLLQCFAFLKQIQSLHHSGEQYHCGWIYNSSHSFYNVEPCWKQSVVPLVWAGKLLLFHLIFASPKSEDVSSSSHRRVPFITCITYRETTVVWHESWSRSGVHNNAAIPTLT